jgi:hypothetical protein
MANHKPFLKRGANKKKILFAPLLFAFLFYNGSKGGK